MMKTLYALFWCGIFFLAAIIGNSDALLNMIPMWLLAGLFVSPWIWIALKAARSNN